MISKELLSELALFNNINGRIIEVSAKGVNIEITYNIGKYFDGNIKKINIYELAQKLRDSGMSLSSIAETMKVDKSIIQKNTVNKHKSEVIGTHKG